MDIEVKTRLFTVNNRQMLVCEVHTVAQNSYQKNDASAVLDKLQMRNFLEICDIIWS